MALGGPSSTRGATSASGGSLLHFMQILRYARPYTKYLVPGMLCIVVVALTYSANIVALLPTIHVIANKQGVPAWAYQSITEHRLGLILFAGESDGRTAILDVKRNSPLDGAVRKADEFVGIDGRPLASPDIFRTIAFADDAQPMRLDLARNGDTISVSIKLHPVGLTHRVIRFAVSYLPQGKSRDDRMATLQIILWTIVGVTVVGGICRFFGEYLIALVAARTVVSLRKRMYQRVLRLPVSHFASHGISDLVSRFVQDSVDVYRGLNFVFAKSLREPLKALFAFFVAMIIDWRITLITVIVAPVAGVLIRRMGKMIRKASKRLLQNYGRMVSVLESSLSGIRVVKGYTMEPYERLRLHVVDREMLRQQLKIERIDAISSPVFEIAGAAVAALAIMYFAQQMFDGRMEFSRFAVLAAAMAAIFDPVRKMSSFYNRLQTANAAMDRVFEVIHLRDETTGHECHQALPHFCESIEFREVSYTYPEAESPAIDGVNLTIRRGERIAFVGPNGSGKTTLLSLLMRFFEPTRGTILLDGLPVQDYSIASLRRQMSLITQDTVIFADTIANNIAYGDEDLLRRRVRQIRRPERHYQLNGRDERIIDAARAAYADEFIREKPQGYDTYVGEHGAQLSGGQKQRLSIARAILRNAPIFIFDEATSQIDSESEHKIHDAIEKFLLDRTALIIAHRFSTILQADRIVVMDKGRIVDSGRHEELMSRCRLYQSLYGTQLIDDTSSPPSTS